MSNMPLARTLALLHPAVLTAIWIVCSLFPISGRPLSSLILISAMCGWAWAVFMVSSRSLHAVSGPAWTPWVYLATPVVAWGSTALGLPTENSPSAFLFFGLLFLGLWRAAQSLEQASAQGRPATIGRIMGTMVLMFFSIVGVWVLRRKIVGVAGPLTA